MAPRGAAARHQLVFALWLPIMGAGTAFALAAIGLVAALVAALLLTNRRTGHRAGPPPAQV